VSRCEIGWHACAGTDCPVLQSAPSSHGAMDRATMFSYVSPLICVRVPSCLLIGWSRDHGVYWRSEPIRCFGLAGSFLRTRPAVLTGGRSVFAFFEKCGSGADLAECASPSLKNEGPASSFRPKPNVARKGPICAFLALCARFAHSLASTSMMPCSLPPSSTIPVSFISGAKSPLSEALARSWR
jgi:hypothetical protein